MARARAIAVLGSTQFIKETYGPEAHERVLGALPAAQRAVFRRPIRDSAWIPLRALAAYCDAAHRLLAPEDADFFRKLGVFTGRIERRKGGFEPMVADPSTAMRLAPVIWRALYDSGEVDFIIQGPQGGLARVRGFRTSRALCQTHCGAIEGMLGTPGRPARVEETACVLEGSAYCEFRVVWD